VYFTDCLGSQKWAGLIASAAYDGGINNEHIYSIDDPSTHLVTQLVWPHGGPISMRIIQNP